MALNERSFKDMSLDQLEQNPWLARVEELQFRQVRKQTTRQKPEEWGPKFLELYAMCGNITTAATGAGVAVWSVYMLKYRDPEFALCIELLRECFVGVLEEEVFRRGISGVTQDERKVVKALQDGKSVVVSETVTEKARRYSDRLLIAMVQAYAPERYKPTTYAIIPNTDGLIAQLAEEEGIPENVIRMEAERIALAARKKKREIDNHNNYMDRKEG